MISRSALWIALLGALMALPAAAAPQSEAKAASESPHKTLDANGDGAIDRSEAAQKPTFAEKFDRYDKNRDGRITADERPQRGAAGKHRRLAGMDADGDGKLSQAEVSQKPKLAERFSAIDRNGDGFLAREEMQAYRQDMRSQPGAPSTPKN